MKEHMNITIESFLTLMAVLYVVINVMVFIVAYQATQLSKRPAPVPVTTVEINGVAYTGQIWGENGVYAISDGDTLLFVADNQGTDTMLASVEDWMQMDKAIRAEVKHIVIDKSITSLDAFALGTDSFKNLETFCVEGHLEKVGAYALAWLPQGARIDFQGGVGEFEMNAVHDHDSSLITGANPGPDALHYYPFK